MRREDETEFRGAGRLHYDRQAAAVSYLYWQRDGSDHVGNGVIYAPADVLVDASRRKERRLELATGKQLKIWISEIRAGLGEASFYTE